MNVRGKLYDAAQATQLSFKPTIDKMEIFVDIYTYKRDLRIAPHLLHNCLPIASESDKSRQVKQIGLPAQLIYMFIDVKYLTLYV